MYELKNKFPKSSFYELLIRWRKRAIKNKAEFEKELREIDFKAWFEKEKLNILQRFHLHSQDGLTPNEVLTYFIEKEILGE